MTAIEKALYDAGYIDEFGNIKSNNSSPSDSSVFQLRETREYTDREFLADALDSVIGTMIHILKTYNSAKHRGFPRCFAVNAVYSAFLLYFLARPP